MIYFIVNQDMKLKLQLMLKYSSIECNFRFCERKDFFCEKIFFPVLLSSSITPLWRGPYCFYSLFFVLAILHPSQLLCRRLSVIADDVIGGRVVVELRSRLLPWVHPSKVHIGPIYLGYLSLSPSGRVQDLFFVQQMALPVIFSKLCLLKISKRSCPNFCQGAKSPFSKIHIFDFELNRPRITGLRSECSSTVLAGPRHREDFL